jgi:hypothetical protein
MYSHIIFSWMEDVNFSQMLLVNCGVGLLLYNHMHKFKHILFEELWVLGQCHLVLCRVDNPCLILFHLKFLPLQWSLMNNLSVNFCSFQIFLRFMFQYASYPRNLKWGWLCMNSLLCYYEQKYELAKVIPHQIWVLYNGQVMHHVFLWELF